MPSFIGGDCNYSTGGHAISMINHDPTARQALANICKGKRSPRGRSNTIAQAINARDAAELRDAKMILEEILRHA